MSHRNRGDSLTSEELNDGISTLHLRNDTSAADSPVPSPASGVTSPLVEDDLEVEEYAPNEQNESRPEISRHFTREDADSIVGGTSVPTVPPEDRDDEVPEKLELIYKNNKVFLFSLPFGGSLGSLSMPKMGLKLPFTHKDPETEEIRLRIQRQESLNTLDEAKYFANQKGTDDVRFRAMKHLIKEGISEILPDFIKKEKPYELVFNDLDGPIVVMGGFRGSILREARTGKRVWIPLKAGFNLRKINLLLGPTEEDELRATDLIYPDGVLKNIGPFDICKKLIKKLDSNPNTVVKEFGYDWRLSLSITSAQLIEVLEKLQKDTGKRPIVIAHSMGGLVAHGALQNRPDLFRGIVYVGSPSECLNILGPIRYGDSVMFSDKILTFETNFMMRSSFAFLPLSGRVFGNTETGEFYDLDYFDPDTWVEYNLNPLVLSTRKHIELTRLIDLDATIVDDRAELTCKSPTDSLNCPKSPTESIGSRIKFYPPGIKSKSKTNLFTNLQMQKRHRTGSFSPVLSSEDEIWAEYKFSFSFEEAYEYLSRTLKQTKEYILGLNYRDDLKHKYPPLAIVYGDTVPSVRGSNVRSRQDIKDGNYYEFFYGRGDGVVHSRWLMPEAKGFQHYNEKTGEGHIVGKFASEAGHVDLMTDLKVMARALDAIVEADKKWKREL